LETDQVF